LYLYEILRLISFKETESRFEVSRSFKECGMGSFLTCAVSARDKTLGNTSDR
jgi:hypothetical protein